MPWHISLCLLYDVIFLYFSRYFASVELLKYKPNPSNILRLDPFIDKDGEKDGADNDDDDDDEDLIMTLL